MTATAQDSDLANVIRFLSMDAVQAANSGHPGMPMGMAEIAVALWHRNLQHNPANPHWANRDRFVLSNGHGSMLLYSLLHLTGYGLPMSELKLFRQLHSKTPGHPEVGVTPGVETTTGPLGQGLSNAVGMAIAERLLAAEFNKPGHEIVDHHTYTFLGDGCMMEGISHEAFALAGTLGLGKLIALYDDNGISIDSEKGDIKSWYSDDVPKRFASYGWQVIANVDGHDVAAVHRAIGKAKRDTDRPTLICCKTTIGKGAPTKANTGSAHGAPLGDKEIAAARESLGWTSPPFVVPEEIAAAWNAKRKGARRESEWKKRFAAYATAFPAEAAEFTRRMAGDLPQDFAAKLEGFIAQTNAKAETIATRKASQNAIEGLAPGLPELLGGSADLAGSNLTLWSGSKPVGREGGGNYLFYGATFLTFSDYARNALRMAALMKLRALWVFTHDSIGLGEDGPTHQSVEHAASLRLMPGLDVWRPCDTVESAVAWGVAVERRDGPSAMLFSRQNVAFVPREADVIANVKRGGYVLADAPGAKAAILATGSEVPLALAAQIQLADAGIAVRVVSMPSTNVFDRQDAAYRAAVLPKGMPRVAVEAGVTDFWRKYVGLEGAVIGIDRYGESAPAGELYKYFGITSEAVAAAVKQVLSPR